MKYELKALGVGGTLDQAIRIYKDHFGLFLAIMLCLQIPLDIATAEILRFVSPEASTAGPDGDEEQSDASDTAIEVRNFVLLIAVNSLSVTISNAAIVHATAHLYLGNATGVRDAFRAAFRRFLPLLWTSAAMSLLIFLGFLFCIIPGIILLLRYCLAENVAVLEGLSGRAALDRSSELIRSTRAHYWMAGALILLVGVIHFGLGQAGGYVPQQHVATVVQAILDAVADSFGLVVLVVFYFSCRCRAEHFDLMQLAVSVGNLDVKPVPAS